MSEKSRMPSLKSLFLVLLLEIVFVFFIIGIFKTVPDRLWAARWASLSFVVQGMAIAFLLWPPWKILSWTFPVLLIFQVLFVWPMALFRWFSEEHFSQLHWMGMSGPILHTWSTYFYYLLILATLVDLVVVGAKKSFGKREV